MPVDDAEYIRLPKKKKSKSKFAKFGDTVAQTKEELDRRDRRMARFQDEGPPRVDTPDYTRDAQIAASIVPPRNAPSF
jgi:hypothetical protein